MKIVATILTAALFSTSSLASDALSVSYSWSGGHSPFREISVAISTSGVARVTGEKQGIPPIDYQTQLTQKELSALAVLVESTQFFSLTEQGSTLVKGAGQTELMIRLGERTRSLTYRDQPSLTPLSHFLWKLITQAAAIQTIASDGDIHSASGAVKPTHAGMKALQPMALKTPLFEYLRTQENRQKAQWALEALAWITTPDEFSGFITLGLKEKKQRNTLLSIIGTHPFYDNIPKSHMASLCPVYFAFARDAYLRVDQLEETDKQALSDFTRLLGVTRYEPSIPMFITWFEEHKKPYVITSITPLAGMGKAGMGVLAPYLDSPEDAHRLNAIELLTIASRTGPHCGFANPVSDSEYEQMTSVFSQSIIPKLLELSTKDTSANVRKKANQAIVEIEQWIKKK